MYTSHGHHIPNTDVAYPVPAKARCGGLTHCTVCFKEAAAIQEHSSSQEPDRISGDLSFAERAFLRGYMAATGYFVAAEDLGKTDSEIDRRSVFKRILQFKGLAPLSDDPDEWVELTGGVWNSLINPEAFSMDRGKTYYLLFEETDSVQKAYTSVPHKKENK